MLMLRYFFFLLCLTPTVVLAHQINGTVRHPNGQPLRETVRITCPPPVNAMLERPTDAQGGFSFFIQATGRCTLNVRGASYSVYSSQNPVRYDLVFDNNMLRRR